MATVRPCLKKIKKHTFKGAGEVAELVKHLSDKNEGLNLDPQHPCKKASKVACACNPRTEEAEMRETKKLAGQPS